MIHSSLSRVLALVVLGIAAPSASMAYEYTSAFVGHYGETLRFNAEETRVTAEMHGSMEFVRFSDTYRYDTKIPERLNPSGDDFASPEKFERLNLRELIVVPKGHPGFNTLSELKAAKLADLKRRAMIYHIQDLPEGRGDWPAGSFAVSIEAPYHLWQIYSQTPKEFFVYSLGVDPKKWEKVPEFQEILDFLEGQYSLSHQDWRDWAPSPLLIVLWLLANVVLLVLTFLPIARWRRRLKIVGFSLLAFSNLCFFSVYALCGANYELGLGLNTMKDFVVAILGLAAVVALVVAWRLKTRRFSLVAGGVLLTTGAWSISALTSGDEFAKILPPFELCRIDYVAFFFFLGLTVGLVYGLLLQPKRKDAHAD